MDTRVSRATTCERSRIELVQFLSRFSSSPAPCTCHARVTIVLFVFPQQQGGTPLAWWRLMFGSWSRVVWCMRVCGWIPGFSSDTHHTYGSAGTDCRCRPSSTRLARAPSPRSGSGGMLLLGDPCKSQASVSTNVVRFRLEATCI